MTDDEIEALRMRGLPMKAGAVFQNDVRPGHTCQSPATHAGIFQAQHVHLVAENHRLTVRVAELEAAIRQHRDERGDDRCHADDGRLYAVLPEGDTRPERETAVTLENCQRYIECRQTGREYVSPQRRIEELEAEVTRLRAGHRYVERDETMPRHSE